MRPPDDIHAALAAQEPLVDQPEPAQEIPFNVGDLVRYAIPNPQDDSYKPSWVEHRGRVLAIDQSGELALLIPETEPGIDWRWVAWVYLTK